MNFKRSALLSLLLLIAALPLYAQTISGIQTDGSRQSNIITAVPFMLIMPQARVGAMGNAGVALDADAGALGMNAAGLAFMPEKSAGASISYSPWLKTLAPDMNLTYLSGYYKIDERNAIGASFRYFSLGVVQFTDVNFQNIGVFNPSELAFDLSYASTFGPDFALGSTVRFIRSGLYNGQFSSGAQSQTGKALAVDVSGLYKKDITMFGKAAIWSMGLNLSNIGTKISYNEAAMPYFLPANFKLGTAAMLKVDQDNSFTLALDLNKLMVPTQPIYDVEGEIVKGQDPNRSVPAGIFGSFADAPGGFSEELQEVSISTGMEYRYQQKFALRAGYNYQHPEKGNSRYLTLGAGFKYNLFNLDLSYLAGNTNKSPLANTLRFSLLASFGAQGTNKN